MFNEKLAKLLDIVMPHAMLRLSEACKFQPFGATINLSGEIIPSVARAGGYGTFTSAENDSMTQEFFELAASQQIQALCICREVLLGESEYAISCILEDIDGEAYDLTLPFARDSVSRSIEFRSPAVKQRALRLFPTYQGSRPIFRGRVTRSI